MPKQVDRIYRNELLKFIPSSPKDVKHSLVLGGEHVDGPLLSGFTPVWLIDLHHLLDTETNTLEET